MSGIFDQVINYAPPSLLKGTVTYKGAWSAATNTPTLINPPDSTTNGFYYVVSAAGTQFSLSFNIGDWIISNGSAWQKVDNTDSVDSVFGRTGAVVGVSTDYSAVGITATAVGASSPSTGAFTTLSATTPLAATSGGTGLSSLGTGVATFLGTPTSANLAAAVTNETGSGSLVFGTSPTITTPVIAQINDASGNETLKLASIASAVNEVTIENAATGNAVHISATGGDASIGLHLVGKGASGYVNVQDSTDATKRIMFNAAGGTTNTRTMLSSTQTVDRTLSLPDATDTLVGRATTDTLTNKTLTSPTITGGALNGTLGATTPSTVAATTITTTSTAGIGGAATFNSSVDQSFSTASTLQLTQTNTNTGAGAGVSIFQYNSGTGAGGDTWIRQFAGTENWSFGVDNSDSSAWKVSRSGTLGTNDVLKLTSTGLNSTAIGATTPSTGAFTTLSASGQLSMSSDTDVFRIRKADNTQVANFGMVKNILGSGADANFALATIGTFNVYPSNGATNVAAFSSTGLAITGTLSATGAISSSAGSSAVPTAANSAFYASASTSNVGYAGTYFDGSTAFSSFLGRVPLSLSGINDGLGYVTIASGTPTLRALFSSTGLAVTGTLSATGNASIGTTSSYGKLTVYDTTNTQIALTDSTLGASYGGAVRGYGVSGLGGYAELGVLDAGTYRKGIRITEQTNSIQFFTASSSTERMRIDSSGNLLIATTSFPSAAHASATQIRVGLTGTVFSQNSAGLGLPGMNLIDNAYVRNSTGDFAYLTSAKASRVVCTSGNVYLQTSTGSDTSDAAVSFSSRAIISDTGLAVTGLLSATNGITSTFDNAAAQGINIRETTNASGAYFTVFRRADSTVIGSITRVSTTDAVVYNTTSDARLKENFRDFTDSGRLIDALKPRVFDWKDSDGNGKNVIGFIAQEEHAADPVFAHIGAVSVGDDDPTTITKQWQRSDAALIPILVAELQSLRKRLAALESK